MAKCPVCGWEAADRDLEGGLLVCSCCHVMTPLPGAKLIPFLRRDAAPSGEIPLGEDFTKHYQLLRVLGLGTSGSLWLARSRTNGKQLSVRFLQAFTDVDRMDRFVREGKSLSQVCHPNLRQIIESGELGGYPYLITEYVEGTALSRDLAQGRVDGSLVLQYLVDIVEGLAVCHESGVVHAGLCPGRILLNGLGRATILDPGLAGELEWIAHGEQVPATPEELDRFRAPEVGGGAAPTVASDLYAAGLIIQDLAGFTRSKTALGELASEATRTVPDERPGTAAKLAGALRGLAAGAGVQLAMPLVFMLSVLVMVLWRTTAPPAVTRVDASRKSEELTHLQQLFTARRFGELNARIERYQNDCNADIRTEESLEKVMTMLEEWEAVHDQALDQWQAATPGSWVPLVVRAARDNKRGWNARGYAWAHETSKDQFARMYSYLERAKRHALTALRMNPRLLYAYHVLIRVNLGMGSQQEGFPVIRQALKMFPDSFELRWAYLHSLKPRWHGSYEAMEAFVRESLPYADKNPRIRKLPAMILRDQGDAAERNGDLSKARLLYEKALTHDDGPGTRIDLSGVLTAQGDYTAALAVMDGSPNEGSDPRQFHCVRGHALLRLQRDEEAIAAFREVQKYEKEEVVAKQFLNEGHRIFEKNLARAVACYDITIRLDPGHVEAYRWRGVARSRRGDFDGAMEDERTAIRLAPRRYEVTKTLVDILTTRGRYDDIIATWNEFLAKEPDNARAHLERGAAYFHKRDLAAARADAQRACDLGAADGCKILQRLGR